jgi:hypothetical protein
MTVNFKIAHRIIDKMVNIETVIFEIMNVDLLGIPWMLLKLIISKNSFFISSLGFSISRES